MTHRPLTRARWHAHVNGVNPVPEMRHWLVDDGSLTVKLVARCGHFRVRRLHQGRGMCLTDEMAVVGLPRRALVRERDVLLQCDGRPVVYAHTIVPVHATAADWPFFGGLGERSLGSTLFGDPHVRRGRLEFARLCQTHPLMRRARHALGAQEIAAQLLARRCLYRRRNGVLLVTEVFLPAIAELGAVPEGQPASLR